MPIAPIINHPVVDNWISFRARNRRERDVDIILVEKFYDLWNVHVRNKRAGYIYKNDGNFEETRVKIFLFYFGCANGEYRGDIGSDVISVIDFSRRDHIIRTVERKHHTGEYPASSPDVRRTVVQCFDEIWDWPIYIYHLLRAATRKERERELETLLRFSIFAVYTNKPYNPR